MLLQEESLKPSVKEALDSRRMIMLSILENTWDYVDFNIDNMFGENIPIIQNFSWKTLIPPEEDKHMELSNLLFKSKEFINYYVCNCNIHCEFTLKGENSFWLFLRAGDKFTTDTAVIMVTKIRQSQTCYISFGTFVKDVHDNLIYKIFTRQQLLDYSKEKNANNIKNDITQFKLEVFDKGEDSINVSVAINGSKKDNKITSDFFLPVIGKYQIALGSIGDKCVVKSGYVSAEFKDEYEKLYSLHANRNECDCCLIM